MDDRETRRRHPLAADGNVVDGIRAERKALSTMREVADRIVDTSALTVHQLKDLLVETYVAPEQRSGLSVSLVSFGFKHGVPFDADLVFDVRFLPNPHFVPELKDLTGNDQPVIEYLEQSEEVRETTRRFNELLDYLIPLYQREGKSYVTVGIGCTGGKHRSVALANALNQHLNRKGFHARVTHRDVKK